MHGNAPHLLNNLRRPLRARLLALLLLIAQVSSLLIVPLHAVAHGRAATSSEATVAGSPGAANPFSTLFGHEQGLACDDWSAAFALDSHAGQCAPVLPAILPTTTLVVGSFQTESPVTPFRPFLARAPPRI